MSDFNNISPGDIVSIDKPDESVPFVVLKTGKAEEFDESIQQQSGLKTIAGCPSDQAQTTLSGQVKALSADDLLVRLVAVPEITNQVPVWWQLDPRFYRPLVTQHNIPYRFVPRPEVQPVGGEEICHNCGCAESARRICVKISMIEESLCNRCEALKKESVLLEKFLSPCDGGAERGREDFKDDDYNA